jgi:hypothetical protein
MVGAMRWPRNREENDIGPRKTGADAGALGESRTPNRLIRSQVLYPLSYERI